MKISTAEKLQRIISIVSWINAQDGPTMAEVCERFDIGQAELIAQLDMASMIGSESEDYGDMPIEVYYEDDRVYVYLHAFERPLRLTPEQGLALLAAGAGLRQAASLDAEGALARALAKVAGVFGFSAADTLEVDLGDADTTLLDRLREAVAGHHPVELDYWSAGRDDRTHRVVEPWRVFNEGGAWYLQGRCRQAEAERVFRVDRMRSVTTLDETFKPPRSVPDAPAYQAGADDPRVVLDLDQRARWVASTYPVDKVEELASGGLRVTMPAGAPAFMARLLLRLGPSATVVDGDDRSGAEAATADAAARILARYRT